MALGATSRTWITCSSESDIRARSTAVWVASSASLELSVARRILVGKMLISFPSLGIVCTKRLAKRMMPSVRSPRIIDEKRDRVAAWISEESLGRSAIQQHLDAEANFHPLAQGSVHPLPGAVQAESSEVVVDAAPGWETWGSRRQKQPFLTT